MPAENEFQKLKMKLDNYQILYITQKKLESVYNNQTDKSYGFRLYLSDLKELNKTLL